MSNLGLSVSDIVPVSIVLSATPAQTRNFGALLILGDSDIIDTTQRMRSYTGSTGIGSDFGTNSPEYLGGLAFFSATPQPSICYVGRWARTSTHGTLMGATLGAPAQGIANFSSIANGGINLTVDGTAHNLTALNLTGVSNLNGVASIIQTALAGSATVTWDATNSRFVVKSTTSGTGSTVALAAAGTGTDLSVILGLNASVSGAYSVAGIAAETALAAVQTLLAQSNLWYGLAFASSVQPSDADYVAVSAAIQAASPTRVMEITSPEAGLLSTANSGDISDLITANRTFIQYSSTSPYAGIAAFANAFTTNFSGANSLYTLMFKTEAGITAEYLTETQSAALKANFVNVYVNYNNSTAILQEGRMSDGTFFDVIHGTDWLQNDLQTAVFNLFLTNRKIAQTDAGVNQIVTTISNELEQAVTNGLVAPGIWNGPPIGAIVTGQQLPKGYYVYAPPVSTQSVAARAARQAPVITVCIKLAGAIHGSAIIVNVNQ